MSDARTAPTSRLRVRTLARELAGIAADAVSAHRAGPRRPDALRVGWVASDTLDGGSRSFSSLRPPVSMRIRNNALWINAHSDAVANEMYRPGRRYDVAVFFKTMDPRAQQEARRIQRYGGKVVFDANVNYYEIWGDYDLPGTRPVPEQQRDAIAMTQLADWVVADSSYLLGIVRKFNEAASFIPDNVDLARYHGIREHRQRQQTRLIWSGVGKKATSLLLVRDALRALRDVELVLVSEQTSEVLDELRAIIPCRFIRFSERRYARALLKADVIISPKNLVNGYELGHTEYKITLGMAVGLPAVASPLGSYVEAIGHAGGGIVAGSPDEWRRALQSLVGDPALRAELGAKAHRTVLERYSTDVVAPQFLELVRRLA